MVSNFLLVTLVSGWDEILEKFDDRDRAMWPMAIGREIEVTSWVTSGHE